jgi:adenine specific DNA methylase Mod
MYPRLRLAKNLLKDDGVIFISIDDHEVHNLRKICDEIFGESNLMGHIHWRRRSNQPNDATKMIGLVAEHVLVYAKSKTNYTISGVGKIKLTGTFTNPDNDPRGEWASKPWKTGSSQSGTRYLVTTPNGIQLDEEWMGDSDNYEKLLADNRIYFPDNGNGSPRKKYFKKEREAEGQSASNWWPHTESGSNQDASKELKKLFDTDKVLFTNPKPTELINRCLELANMDNGDIALDFFLGSGTTAEAVQKYNAETGKRIRFIGVQIPEDLNPDTVSGDQKLKAIIKNARDFLLTLNKPANIFELARERILRSSSIYSSYDSGFKVFKLDTTNFREWDTDTADIEQSLLDALNTFVIFPQRRYRH